MLALPKGKMVALKYSLLGSILSNLLLVLGSSLFIGGLANLSKEQKFDRKQADVDVLLLSLGVLCHALPLFLQYSTEADISSAGSILRLSRGSSIILLVAYVAHLFFQLKTHQQFFDSEQEVFESNEEEKAVIGLWSAFSCLVGMTAAIAVLSEYVGAQLRQAAASSWGVPVHFLSVILLPIVGNAAEHAGAIIFAYKNKLVPLCVIIAWMMHIEMDLRLSFFETGSFAASVITVAFALQDGSSHYMKGAVLLFGYMIISACFFVLESSPNRANLIGSRPELSVGFSAS
ncbi:hypothetical protein Cgig2_005028 [Carnegiea gigantea]|uniref:Sodium/calcium exchanger membrane region domain-containing protein n=1 Tax=Carnegiea gigantea TaxID=171969 RepID=A0A9Q1KZK7_9CARY|nr:hypothetical protein Cgig2_005028 [Carnegiea gigantea]